VVFDFDLGWCRRMGIEPGQVQEWDELHILAGLDTPAEFWAWFQESGGFKGLPLYEEARAALELAQARGWFIIYATNRPNWAMEHTFEELARFSLPQANHLYRTDRKWEVSGDLYLEDAPHNLWTMMESGCRVLPVAQPWNRRFLEGWLEYGWIERLTPDTLRPHLVAVEEHLTTLPQGS